MILEGFWEVQGFKGGQSFVTSIMRQNISACTKRRKRWNFKWGGTSDRFGISELLELRQFLSRGKDLMKPRVE